MGTTAGLSCRVLRTQLHSGWPRIKLVLMCPMHLPIYLKHLIAMKRNGFLMEVLVATMKRNGGCRFSSYAYWWIRQTIRKAIFHHSRTIRLPDNVYALLGKIKESKRLYVQEGNHDPTKEELARRTGITVDRLDKLLCMARVPLSMQQPIWADQDTTFQVTALPLHEMLSNFRLVQFIEEESYQV